MHRLHPAGTLLLRYRFLVPAFAMPFLLGLRLGDGSAPGLLLGVELLDLALGTKALGRRRLRLVLAQITDPLQQMLPGLARGDDLDVLDLILARGHRHLLLVLPLLFGNER